MNQEMIGRLKRIGFLAAWGIALWGLAFTSVSHAQDWPSKTIRLVVGFAPGGTTDQIARLVALRLQEQMKNPVIVDNRPGAGGNSAAAHLAKTPLDDHTFHVISPGPFSINQYLYKSALGFNPETDFASVGLIVQIPNAIVVRASSPYRTFAEFIEYAKKHPNELNYSTAGVGTTGHLLSELINSRTGIKTVHVPYKGDGPAMTALLGGEVQFAINNNLAQTIPMVRDGRLRALAVTGPKRIAQLADVPTVSEIGFAQLATTVWFGMVAQAQMPKANIDRMNQALNAVLTNSDVARELGEKNFEPLPGPPEALTEMMRKDRVRWKAVIEASGARID